MSDQASDLAGIPIPTIDQLSGLLGDYLDESHSEVLEDDVLISASYEVLVYNLREVARGGDFLRRPTVSFRRFFIFIEKVDEVSGPNLDVVGLIDFKFAGGRFIPVHWQRGQSVQNLLSAADAMGSKRVGQYILRFIGVDSLHFYGIWLISPTVVADEVLIPTSDLEGLTAFTEYPVEQVAMTLVGMAQEREKREMEYYERAVGEALDKLEDSGAGDSSE